MQMVVADVCNRAFDNLGSPKVIGDLSDGSDESELLRRTYGQTLRQLLRAANWNFARKMAHLQLLGDATQTTPPPGVSPYVEQPWYYAYAWPTDGVKARFVPWDFNTGVDGVPAGNESIPDVPLTGPGTSTPAFPPRLIPTRFVAGSSDQYPSIIGQTDWTAMPDLTEGTGLINRRIILTNVRNARLVYTALVTEIEVWDELFSEAMVATLASRLALRTIDDKKLALQMRNEQVAIAKNAVTQARIADGNEGWYSTDHMPEWITRRSHGGWGGGYGLDGPGVLGYGWDTCSWADGSVY